MNIFFVIWSVVSMVCPPQYGGVEVILTPGIGGYDAVYHPEVQSGCQCISKLDWSFQLDSEKACRKAEEHPGALVFDLGTLNDPVQGYCEVEVFKTFRFVTRKTEEGRP